MRTEYTKYQGENSPKHLVIEAPDIASAASGKAKVVRQSNSLSAAVTHADRLTRQGRQAYVAFGGEIVAAGSR